MNVPQYCDSSARPPCRVPPPFPWTIPFAFIVFFFAYDIAPAAQTADPRPNVLFILLDNVGKDWFRCYGSQEDQTPVIDRLARTGLKFRNFYVTPVCSTTRVMLLGAVIPFAPVGIRITIRRFTAADISTGNARSRSPA